RHGGSPGGRDRPGRRDGDRDRPRPGIRARAPRGSAEGLERSPPGPGGRVMRASEIRVGVLLIEGTNCEEESVAYLRSLREKAEKVHLKQLTGDAPAEMRRDLDDYDILMIPGGFAAGDYIRAGAIFAARLRSKLSKDLVGFVKAGKPVFGVCKGTQVLAGARGW